jgi:hypothetical protein
LAIIQKTSVTDMITAINANAVNLTSAADAVLRKCLADSQSSVGVTAKE